MLFFLLLTSCFEEEPGNSPVVIFETVWNDFSTSYPSFEERSVDWDLLYSVYRPRVNNSINETQLFAIISEMLLQLKDGHVKITNSRTTSQYVPGTGKPVNFLGRSFMRKKLTSVRENNVMMSGLLSPDLGYVYIESWGSISSQYLFIDQCINDFKNVKALIIDVRNNGGGADVNAKEVMGRFSSERVLSSFVRYKSGPGRNDFGNYLSRHIEPKGNSSFLNKPIFVLANRRCFSSNDYFIVSMKSLSNVTLVGDTTGGGAANAVPRELRNGWIYTMPRWKQYDVDKKTFEGKGIYPNYPVWISKSDSLNGKDLILEKAVSLVK